MRRDGQIGLLDRFLPRYVFTIISTVGRPELALDARQRAALASVGVTYLRIGRDGDADDVDGAYQAYLRTHGADAMIVRPDFYVFGLAPSLADLPSLVDELLGQLAFTEPRPVDRQADMARSFA